jgi:hypothetical protein
MRVEITLCVYISLSNVSLSHSWVSYLYTYVSKLLWYVWELHSACLNRILFVETNFERVEITFVHVVVSFMPFEVTLRVEIRLCVYKSHYTCGIASCVYKSQVIYPHWICAWLSLRLDATNIEFVFLDWQEIDLWFWIAFEPFLWNFRSLLEYQLHSYKFIHLQFFSGCIQHNRDLSQGLSCHWFICFFIYIQHNIY